MVAAAVAVDPLQTPTTALLQEARLRSPATYETWLTAKK